MGKRLVCTAVGAAIFATASASFGAGLKINEQGAKAMGMANAFAAQADDPSALYYNPAGIAYLKGGQVSMGSVVISVPQTQFNGTTGLSTATAASIGAPNDPVDERAKKDLFIAPQLYATYSMESLPLTFGLAVNSIYPLAKSWDDSSNFRNQVQNISVKPINFQPTVAYRFDSLNLAVAAGLDVTHSIVSMSRTVAVEGANGPDEMGRMGLDGTSTDVGYNLGLRWTPIKEVTFGAAYRSEITMHIDGGANFLATDALGFSTIGAGAQHISPTQQLRVTSPQSTAITLPDSLSLAVAVRPMDRLTWEFDAERTGWSSLNNLNFKFDSTQFNQFNNQPIPLNWKDAWCYKTGVNFAANKAVDLRAGYAYDTNPIPDSTLGPMLPDADRHNVSFGVGFHNDNFTVDLAYMWVHWVDRTVNNQNNTALTGENGTFKSDAHLFGANLTVKF